MSEGIKKLHDYFTISNNERIKEWKDCERHKDSLPKDLQRDMCYHYLLEIWKLQEIGCDLPEEFDGLQ